MSTTHVELGSLEPDVLALGTKLTALRDDLAGGDHLFGVLLEGGGGDPAGGVLRVCVGHRLKESASALNISAMWDCMRK